MVDATVIMVKLLILASHTSRTPPLVSSIRRPLGNKGATKDVLKKGDRAYSDRAYWNTHPPHSSIQSTGSREMRYSIQAHSDSDIECMWVQRVETPSTPHQPGDTVSASKRIPGDTVSVSKRIPVGGVAFLTAILPEGRYVAAVWSSSHGLWTSGPFTIRYNCTRLWFGTDESVIE